MVVAMANNGQLYSTPPPPPPPGSVQQLVQNYAENNRLYHGWQKGKYMFPCDEVIGPGSAISISISMEEAFELMRGNLQPEMDRMDIYHKLFLVARKEKLHSTPLTFSPDSKLRILDLGTGTGIWAIDMAFKYHTLNPDILGIDLSLIQPESIPPGLTFLQRDIELPWTDMGLESWDLIHMRMLNGSLSSWQDTYEKIFRHLKPGSGWMEHVEIDLEPRCDDGSLPPNGAIVEWYKYLMDAMRRVNRPMTYNHETRDMLHRQGFTDISEQVIDVPLNSWPSDPHQKDIGRWYNLGLTQGLNALSIAPFTRTFRWSEDDVARVTAGVKKEICSRKIHVYCKMHIWTARRPAKA